ncbi:MAG: DUF3226 domain-containing protein [Deltaproteobacteria bacterium]
MSNFIYIIAEGVLDVVVIAQVLRRGFEATIVEQKLDLPTQAQNWLDTFKWPINDNIARRAVPAPAFVKSDTFIVGLRNAQGLTNIKRTVNADMEAFLRMKWQPTAMGVILDADTEPPANRFADFATFLHAKGYPNPVNLDIVARSNGLRAGVFAFPGQGQPGTLEDVLLPLAAARFPDLSQHAYNYVNAWFLTTFALNHTDFNELRSPSGRKKAIISSILSLSKPAKPIAASVEDHHWIPKTPRACATLAPLMNFLDQLLSVDETGIKT